MTIFMISQILVATAIIFDLLSFQFKNRKYILLCLISASILISLHFLLLEKWTAAALMMVAFLRFSTSYFTTSLKARNFFILLSILVSIITFQNFLSIISCIAAIFGTLASFHKEDRQLRQLMVLGSSFWILHNALVFSPVAVIMETIFLSSNLIGYYRFYLKKSTFKTKN